MALLLGICDFWLDVLGLGRNAVADGDHLLETSSDSYTPTPHIYFNGTLTILWYWHFINSTPLASKVHFSINGLENSSSPEYSKVQHLLEITVGLFSVGVGLFFVTGGLGKSPPPTKKSPTPTEKSPTLTVKSPTYKKSSSNQKKVLLQRKKVLL